MTRFWQFVKLGFGIPMLAGMPGQPEIPGYRMSSNRAGELQNPDEPLLDVPAYRPTEGCNFLWPKWIADSVGELVLIGLREDPQEWLNTYTEQEPPWYWPIKGICYVPLKEDELQNQFRFYCREKLTEQMRRLTKKHIPWPHYIEVGDFRVQCPRKKTTVYYSYKPLENDDLIPTNDWRHPYLLPSEHNYVRDAKHCFCGPKRLRPGSVRARTKDCIRLLTRAGDKVYAWAASIQYEFKSARMSLRLCGPKISTVSHDVPCRDTTVPGMQAQLENNDVLVIDNTVEGQYQACLGNSQEQDMTIYIGRVEAVDRASYDDV